MLLITHYRTVKPVPYIAVSQVLNMQTTRNQTRVVLLQTLCLLGNWVLRQEKATYDFRVHIHV